MYSIVIADDEQLERMVLQQQIEEHLGDRCKIRMAANGHEAVDVALLAKADLIIMDIEMPGINGLEASRLILQKLPYCKIIMLTAYSEFEYAREAIAFGSADYLLKPCADDDLHSTLDRVLLQINKFRESAVERERSIQRINKLSGQIEEQIVQTVMGGHITPDYILSQMKKYGVHFCNGIFAILYSINTGNTENIVSALKGISWPEHIHPFLYCYDGKIYIVNVSDQVDKDCFAITVEHLSMLSQAAKTLWRYPLLGAVGKSFSNIQFAQLSCFQAQVSLSKCSEDTPIVVYEEDSDVEQVEATDNLIINCVLFGDVDEISHVSASLVNSLFAQHLEMDTIINRINYLLAQTVTSLKNQTSLQILDIGVSIAPEEFNIENLIHKVTFNLCHLAEELIMQDESKDAKHLQKIKGEIEKYVTEHYNEDIFLPDIAREMNYSSAYFSKLFKQCFQRNFINYLTDIRINAAKDMIRNSSLTIREIGENVGYKDPNYFTKVFRKVVGANPSEYREFGLTQEV